MTSMFVEAHISNDHNWLKRRNKNDSHRYCCALCLCLIDIRQCAQISNARRNRAHFNEIEIKFASEFNEITMSNEIVLVYSGFLFSMVFCFVFVILLYILLYLRFIIFPCFAEEERERAGTEESFGFWDGVCFVSVFKCKTRKMLWMCAVHSYWWQVDLRSTYEREKSTQPNGTTEFSWSNSN